MTKMSGNVILLYIHVYHKWRWYDIWFLKYKVRQTNVFVILGHSLPFHNPDEQEQPEKFKIWDMACDGHNFLLFWTIFSPFNPLPSPTNLKYQNFEKMKKSPGGTIIFHKCTKNHDHMLHCSWDTMCDVYNSYFLFWVIFCPFTLLTTQKIKNYKKMISSF